MSNQEGRTSRSVTLDDDLWVAIDRFCDDRVLGQSKFLGLASRRLISTAPTLPEPEEPATVGPLDELSVETRRVRDEPQA